jgi:hypothetical protein
MKKLIGIVLFVLFLSAGAFAQIGIRNISSAQVDLYFNDQAAAAANGGAVEKLALDINQVVLFPVTGWLSGELKIQRQDEIPVSTTGTGWRETTVSMAPIFIVSPYNYIIVRYGLGIGTGYERPAGGPQTTDDEVRLSHDLTIDANHETARFFANLTLRGSFYGYPDPIDDYWFVLPAAGVKYFMPSGLGLGGKYFFSYNSLRATSHAFLGEVEYRLQNGMVLRAGGSVTYYPDEVRENRWNYTGLAGASFAITETARIRYQAEYLGRQSAGPGLRNILVLDFRI